MSGPLEGTRVVEFCDGPGELAGKILADMGADVIKVEPPDGSKSRTIGPFVDDQAGPNRSLHFWYHNTNKRSAVAELDEPEVVEAVRALTAAADIVVEDHQPGWLAAALGPLDVVQAESPRLVVCSITPFGQDGPWAEWSTTDLVSLALGGPMAMNGYSPEDREGVPPIRGHGDQGYNTGCHHAVIGIMAALLHRDSTGEGQLVDCSMHEALSCTTEVGMPYYLYQRRDVVRQTGRHAAVRPTEPWLATAGDGRDLILYGRGRDNRTWAQLKKWMQEHGYGRQFDEERFDSPRARQPGAGSAEAAEITQELLSFVAASTADEIYRGGQSRRQAWGAVRSPEETLDDVHLQARGFFVKTTGEGRVEGAEMPGAPYQFSETPWELRRPAPQLGEHTADIFEHPAEPWPCA